MCDQWGPISEAVGASERWVLIASTCTLHVRERSAGLKSRRPAVPLCFAGCKIARLIDPSPHLPHHKKFFLSVPLRRVIAYLDRPSAPQLSSGVAPQGVVGQLDIRGVSFHYPSRPDTLALVSSTKGGEFGWVGLCILMKGGAANTQ